MKNNKSVGIAIIFFINVELKSIQMHLIRMYKKNKY